MTYDHTYRGTLGNDEFDVTQLGIQAYDIWGIDGNNSDDTLIGGYNFDRIYGNYGNDSLDGNDGNDDLYGVKLGFVSPGAK